jgi:hypothetical protein
LVAELETAIRNYLAAHPGAADSAAGIQRWWLPHALSGRPLAELERVLAQMAASGKVSEIRLPDGTVMFGTVRHPGRAKPVDGTASK